MQPTYYFCNFLLILKYAEVWFECGSFQSVVAMGYTVNIFALVRVYYNILNRAGMASDTMYDMSVILAGVTNIPIALGPTGCIQFISSLFIWNFIFGVLFSHEKRSLIQVNRTYEYVFPTKYNGKQVDFSGTFRKYRDIFDDDRVAVARAAFHIIAGDKNTIELEELEELFEGWGLLDTTAVAEMIFSDADLDEDGVIDFTVFSTKLWFVWERILEVEEVENDENGILRSTKVD